MTDRLPKKPPPTDLAKVLSSLTVTLADFQRDYTEGKRLARESQLALTAKLDNLDRSIGEMRLLAEQAETARKGEMQRIFDLLGHERQDRRELQASGKDDKDFVREIIREEMGTRKKNHAVLVTAGKAVWTAGGQWIVLGVTVLIVAAVLKLAGLNLSDILGLVNNTK